MTPHRFAGLERDEQRSEAVPLLCQLRGDEDGTTVAAFREEEGYHAFGPFYDELVAVAGVPV